MENYFLYLLFCACLFVNRTFAKISRSPHNFMSFIKLNHFTFISFYDYFSISFFPIFSWIAPLNVIKMKIMVLKHASQNWFFLFFFFWQSLVYDEKLQPLSAICLFFLYQNWICSLCFLCSGGVRGGLEVSSSVPVYCIENDSNFVLMSQPEMFENVSTFEVRSM